MATRSVLVFSDRKDEKLEYGVPIYKHWDGYPSNILHLLRQYIEVNKERLTDIPYLSSGFLRYIELYDYEDKIPDKFKDIKEETDDMAYDERTELWKLKDPYTGYGLFQMDIGESVLSGWEDYYYKITPEEVYCYNGEMDEKNHPELLFKIKVKDLISLPDKRDFFEKLEKGIFQWKHPEWYSD